jgi:hypothetical protein
MVLAELVVCRGYGLSAEEDFRKRVQAVEEQICSGRVGAL